MPSKGYTSSARVSSSPGAFAMVPATDFGQPIPGVFTASDVGSGGSLNATEYLKITWVTAQGESLPSAEVTRTVSGGPSGSISIAQPAVPTNGAPIIGWRLYAGLVSGTNYLATLTTQVTEAQVTTTTTQGSLKYFPIATTTLTFKLAITAGSTAPTVDRSGAQVSFPSVAANVSADYFFVVGNSGGDWKVQKKVSFMRPSGTTETAGIAIVAADCVAPVYPAGGATPALGSYVSLNGYVFVCTVSGAVGATFPGWSTFNTTVGATTVDTSATWTSLGKAALIRVRFDNSSASAAIPVAQEYDFFEE